MPSAYNKRQWLMAKLETTYGTSSSPTGTNAIRVRDPKLTILDAKAIARPSLDGQFGEAQFDIMSELKMGVGFDIEAVGSGVAGTAPAYGIFLQAAGMNLATVATTSNTYSFATAAADSLSLYHDWDGNKHAGVGGRTKSWELKMTAGEVPLFSFDVPAIYVPPVDATSPTATYSNMAAPVVCNSVNTPTFSLFGYNACIIDFSLKCDNDQQFYDFMGCSPKFEILDRTITGSIKIQRPAGLSEKDFYAAAVASTSGAINFTHNTVAGNRMVASLPKVQLGAPAADDASGLAALTLPFTVRRTPGSSDAGTIAFT